MAFKNGFNCAKCPENNGEKGCPCWIDGMAETNIQTGEERISRGCLFTFLPRWLTLVIQASNRPAAAFESARNEIVKAINTVSDQQVYLLKQNQFPNRIVYKKNE